MLKFQKKTNFGGLKALQAKAQASDGLIAEVGVTSKSNKQTKGGVSMAQIAQWLERGWAQHITAKQAGYFRANFGMNLKVNNVLYMPPRPFLTLTAKKNMSAWLNLYKRAVSKGKMSPLDALSLTARTAQEDVRQTIINGGVGGVRFAERSPMTMNLYRERTQGKKTEAGAGMTTTKPLFATGALFNSIAYLIKKKGT